jgi:hypothetical protein
MVLALRRHPRRSLLAFAALLVGACASVYWYSRPPPADPVVRVAVVALPPVATRLTDAMGNLYAPAPEGPETAADYRVTALVPGDTVHVLGFEGPGLVAAHASHGRASVVTLSARIDCSTPAWQVAQDQAYRLRVVKTDRYGRNASATIPLPKAYAADWRQYLQQSCLGDALSDGARANAANVWTRTGDGDEYIAMNVRLHNPFDVPIFLQLAYPGGAASGPRLKKVPAGSAAWLSTSWPLWRCSEYKTDLFGWEDGLLVRAGVQRFGAWTIGPFDDPHQTGVNLPHELSLDLRRQLSRACHPNDL